MPPDESAPPSPLDDKSPAGHSLHFGSYRVWFAYDSYSEPDTLLVYIELGAPDTLDVAFALNLLLSLCLEVDGASRGRVVRHPETGQLIYRFRYALDDDPEGVSLVDTIAELTAKLDGDG